MVRTRMNTGDKVQVFGNDTSYTFTGVVVEVSAGVAEDVWYKVKPDGEGVAQGRSFWHRESHVKKVSTR